MTQVILLHWAIENPQSLLATFTTGPVQDHRRGFAEDLAVLGDGDTIALLQSWVDDTEIGDAATTTIRTIKSRRHWSWRALSSIGSVPPQVAERWPCTDGTWQGRTITDLELQAVSSGGIG